MPDPLKVGLIVDDETLNKYDYELVQWANLSDSLRITHLIIQKRNGVHFRKSSLWMKLRRRSFRSIIVDGLWKVLWTLKERMETRELNGIDSLKDADTRVSAHDIALERITVVPQISKSGFVYRYLEEDLQRIRDEKFDILIRGGSGILRGGVLTSARLGVLSFHHGDNTVNRGGPAGFWEVYHGWPKTGFVIQRLTEELDGGDVVFRGYATTERSHLVNRAMVRRKSYSHLRRVLSQIAAKRELPIREPPTPYSGPLYVKPGVSQLAMYLAKRTYRSIRGRTRGAMGLQERWGVSFIKSNWVNAALWRGIQLKTPEGSFLADPFVVEREGRTCVFVEEYRFGIGKAHISVYELGQNESHKLGEALNERFHLSFPFLFDYRGELFMCPESVEAREIRIYRCLEFPLRWKLECVAIKNVPAADSMIFEYGGRWWLFTNLCESDPIENSTELHIFSAADPLSGAWTPHHRNPVIVDPEGGRNGGLLFNNGDIVRVSQLQGFDSYGSAARLMQIKLLSEEAYEETLLCNLTPTFSKGISGTHHLHSNGRYTVWDFKRRERIRA